MSVSHGNLEKFRYIWYSRREIVDKYDVYAKIDQLSAFSSG